jgi:hypothetical protein
MQREKSIIAIQCNVNPGIKELYNFIGKLQDNFPPWVYICISIKGLRSKVPEPCLLNNIPEGTIGNDYI